MSIDEAEFMPESRPALLRRLEPRKLGLSQSAAPNFFAAVYFVSILVSPFNSIKGVAALGELGSDSFSILQILLFPFVVTSLVKWNEFTVDQRLLRFGVALTIAIFAGVVAHFQDIAAATDKGRSGFNKLITSTAVLYAGLYFTNLTAIAARLDFRGLFVKPLLIVTAFTMLVGCVEFAAWHSSAVESVYLVFSRIVHSGNGIGQYVPGRIHSVTLEPSFFGAFVCFASPWLLLKIVETRGRAGSLLGYGGLLLLTLTLSLLSGRTAQIGGPGTVAAFFLIWAAFRVREDVFPIVRYALCVGLVLGFVLPIFYFDLNLYNILQKMYATGSVSNISRFGTIMISIQLAKENPLFGVGMGQYGFYVPTHVPDWAMNWEFKRWITEPVGSFFPSFALTARLAGEIGGFGLLIWAWFGVVTLDKVIVAARRYQLRTGATPLIGVAIVTSLFGGVFYGWSAGSLRALNLWAAFGLALAYAKYAERLELPLGNHVLRRPSRRTAVDARESARFHSPTTSPSRTPGLSRRFLSRA